MARWQIFPASGDPGRRGPRTCRSSWSRRGIGFTCSATAGGCFPVRRARPPPWSRAALGRGARPRRLRAGAACGGAATRGADPALERQSGRGQDHPDHGAGACGFGFAGDDVALIDAKGHCLGLPFAPAVKAGAWRLLAEACPELAAAPVFRRPDRRRVRYPVPKRFEMPSPPRRLGGPAAAGQGRRGAARTGRCRRCVARSAQRGIRGARRAHRLRRSTCWSAS